MIDFRDDGSNLRAPKRGTNSKRQTHVVFEVGESLFHRDEWVEDSALGEHLAMGVEAAAGLILLHGLLVDFVSGN